MIARVNIKRKAVPGPATIALLLGLSGISSAQAVTVFSENFEGYTSFPTSSGSNARNDGIPMKLAEGAQEAWYAARFQTGSGGSNTGTMAEIEKDLAVLTNGGGSNTTNVGRFEDDAGLLFKLNTTGLDSVNLSFNWATANTSSTDKLVVGYHIGPISGFGACSGNGEAGCFADLRATLPWYTTETVGATTLTGNWTQLLSGNSSGGWQSASILLPDAVENNSEVWFALWLNNGNNDSGLIDNVLVTAVPEVDTYAMMLAGLSLIGFSVSRRKQN